MMRNGGLANVAGLAEVAGADLHARSEAADDGQSGRIGERGEQADLGIEAGGSDLWHQHSISADFDMDKVRQDRHIDIYRYRNEGPA